MAQKHCAARKNYEKLSHVVTDYLEGSDLQ